MVLDSELNGISLFRTKLCSVSHVSHDPTHFSLVILTYDSQHVEQSNFRRLADVFASLVPESVVADVTDCSRFEHSR